MKLHRHAHTIAPCAARSSSDEGGQAQRAGGLLIEDVPKPEPAQGDALVQVEIALAEGADLRRYRQAGELAAPFGSEFCGYLDGRRVVAAGSFAGACADWILVPAEIAATNLLDVPIGLSSEVAALVGPLACSLRRVGAAEVSAGRTAAVLGGGWMSLLLAACVADAGGRAMVVGGRPAYEELAAGFGAEIGDGHSVDIVIEAGEVEQGSAGATPSSLRAALGFLAVARILGTADHASRPPRRPAGAAGGSA